MLSSAPNPAAKSRFESRDDPSDPARYELRRFYDPRSVPGTATLLLVLPYNFPLFQIENAVSLNYLARQVFEIWPLHAGCPVQAQPLSPTLSIPVLRLPRATPGPRPPRQTGCGRWPRSRGIRVRWAGVRELVVDVPAHVVYHRAWRNSCCSVCAGRRLED